jgi:hypothetical protein
MYLGISKSQRDSENNSILSESKSRLNLRAQAQEQEEAQSKSRADQAGARGNIIKAWRLKYYRFIYCQIKFQSIGLS